MTRDVLEALAQLVDLANEDRIVIDWVEVERELGLELPADYKEFATRFGAGHFRDGYLWVVVPTGEGPRLNFFESLYQNMGILAEVRSSGIKVPYPLYPDKGGLIPWGSTVDGDVFYWITEHHDPDHWAVVVNEVRADNWFESDRSMTQLLYAILSGQLVIGFLEQGLGSGPHSFVRL